MGAALFLFIRLGDFGMRAQIVPESEVTCDFRRIRNEEVKVGNAVPDLTGQSAIPPSFDTKFSVPFETERDYARALPIKINHIGNEGH
jgi:hypothetical protein